MNDLERRVTGRDDDLFAADLETRRGDLVDAIGGTSFLVLGGAGSIGKATVDQLVRFSPARVVVVDHSENNLTEQVRALRSRPEGLDVQDFRTYPIDMGSTTAQRLIRAEAPFDYVLNFAALKHVRSEKDVFSTLQMLDTNLVKAHNLQRWVGDAGGTGSFFSVSSDKAVRPASVMGATKRAMEYVLFRGEHGATPPGRVTSARFANVTFSDGSLLSGFLQRLRLRQPIAVPFDIKRYFVTSEEAGALCLLAGVLCPDHHLVIPRLDGARHLRTLESVAYDVIRWHGYEPEVVDELRGRRHVEDIVATGRWPVLLTPPDTVGEKPYEEFVAAGEEPVEIGLQGARAVKVSGEPSPALIESLQQIEGWIRDPSSSVDKQDVVAVLRSLVPEFQHRDSQRTLDERI